MFMRLALSAVAASLSLATASRADLVTYTFSINAATGSLNGTAFTFKPVVFKMHADTADIGVGPYGWGLSVLCSSGTVSVAGSTYDITATVYAWANEDGVGMHNGLPIYNDYMGGRSQSLVGYQLQALGTTQLSQAYYLDLSTAHHPGMATSGGVLHVDSGSIQFTATVPAPGGLALLGLLVAPRARRRCA